MSREKYCGIISELCNRLGVVDAESKYEICPIEVEGAAFTLAFQPEKSINSMFIYCDFGEVKAEMRFTILNRLLEVNYSMRRTKQASFTMNPETKRIIYVFEVPLDFITIDSLFVELAETAAYVKLWRDKFFLLDTEREAAILIEEEIRNAA